jgi:hypothetical protein
LALIVRARFQSRWAASFSAASLAPAKFGIRPSAPGKRETPSRSIAFQTSARTSSLVRTMRKISRPAADKTEADAKLQGRALAEPNLTSA